MTTRFTEAFVQPGCTLTLTAPYDRTGGQCAKIGAILCVATGDVLSGADGEFLTEGVFNHAKTSAQAWTVGDRLYWDDTNKRFDTDSTVGMFAGVATAVAANPSSAGTIKLADPVPMLEGAQTAVANVATADADATYGSPEATLINELKAQVNLALAALRTAGILLP